MSTTTYTRELTVRDAFEEYYLLHSFDLSRRSRQRSRHDLNRWEAHTRNPPVAELTTADFNHFRKSCMAKGLTARTIEGTVATVLAILRHIGPPTDIAPHGIGLIEAVPYAGRRLPRPRPVPTVPTVDELGAMYAEADCTRWPHLDISPADFWRCFIPIAYFTALRLDDLMHGLRWDCWDRKTNVLTIKAGKTGWNHLIPLHPVAVRHLQGYVDRMQRNRAMDLPGDRQRIFPVSKSPHIVRREMRRMCKAAGIRTITPHQIRKAGITELTAVHETAGKLLHGTSLGILDHYAGVRILQEHLPKMAVPSEWKTDAQQGDAA